MSGLDWQRVAAPGTDPGRLRRLVAVRAGTGGGPRTLARRAATLALEDPALPPEAVVDRLTRGVAPDDVDLLDGIAGSWARLGVRVCLAGDPTYPARLLRGWPQFAPPLLLAYRGPDPGIHDRPAVAIVGARRASGYGTGVAAWLGQAFAAAGVTVVSGGAVGIDAAAHRATAGTRHGTVVVLGCGHDVRYPQAHARAGGLFAEVLADGGWLVSEELPGTAPHPANVLARNRIVAGLADAVVVVEGGARSGSLRTATAAADRGVPVFAVPGDVRAPGSAAPNRLLREGAFACTGPADVLAHLDLAAAGDDAPEHRASVLSPTVRAALADRWPRPIRVDDLAAVAGQPIGPLLAALTRARIAGEVAEGADGVRLTRAP